MNYYNGNNNPDESSQNQNNQYYGNESQNQNQEYARNGYINPYMQDNVQNPGKKPRKKGTDIAVILSAIISVIVVAAVTVVLLIVLGDKKSSNSHRNERDSERNYSEETEEEEKKEKKQAFTSEPEDSTESVNILPQEQVISNSDVEASTSRETVSVIPHPETLATHPYVEEETEQAPQIQYKLLDSFSDALVGSSASSQLATENIGGKTYQYSPEMCYDGNLTTCWAEGKSDDGIGESIRFEFDDLYMLSGFEIYSGLCTSKELFEKNSRLHKFTLRFSDGNEFNYELGDGYENCHVRIDFTDVQPVTDYVEIIIDSVYQGNTYSDTCISELSFF